MTNLIIYPCLLRPFPFTLDLFMGMRYCECLIEKNRYSREDADPNWETKQEVADRKSYNWEYLISLPEVGSIRQPIEDWRVK